MTNNSTASTFAEQWRNPNGFLSLLMIIGPIIQSALAQLTGPFFVPICFSFGWASYAFSAISAVARDGRLMPAADHACKVINLDNGYARANRSWIIGRLLRDLEKSISNEALLVEIYEASEPPNGYILAGKSRWFALGAILVQIGISIIPFALSGDWGIFIITMLGTCLAIATAALPQWRVEKLACRARSEKKVAITTGNGSRYIMVIIGKENCLDIEDLAAGEGPPFKEYTKDEEQGKRAANRASSGEIMKPYTKKLGLRKEVKLFRGLPIDFWLTRLFCGIFALVWAVVLILVLALKKNAWYLAAVGTVGMSQNAIVAAASLNPEARGFHLKKDRVMIGDKVMDVLMELDGSEPGCGRSSLKEFFPAGLDIPYDRGEKDW
ncbi:unnamed protein product [Clonostachys rhizophaga]|uniref:Uncharacterized protein n=1 Tax=Clonostachys rhizophaga TaxID=160324 RepID=A0A9N9VM98_9HYPO|nr:unnamed protein product [Clonostachys rhizophaga]